MSRLALTFVVSSLVVPFSFPQTSEQIEFFEKKVRPVLVEKCQTCHNPRMMAAKLDVTTAEGFFKGGEAGPLVNAAEPGKSLLLRVLSYDERLKMPPTGKLSAETLADLAAWVKMGAPWPGFEQQSEGPSLRQPPKTLTEREKGFWAFQPLSNPQPPKVRNEAWVKSPVDRFLLARMEEKGLMPAPPANKLTLLRRATFDLTGLPPTEEEIAAFLADESADAFARVVDRLLASPRYGERWGRKWLDVARYADSTGNDEDHRYPYAWRYRDYVIEAFNNDLPYDQFIREQIAGDLLPSADLQGVNRRGIVATGFLALGAKAIAQQDKKKMLYDVYDEQVDVVSKALLGQTLACARCHDHKFDPFSTKDYYSLVSIFASTRSFKDPEAHVSKLLFVPLVPKAEYERYQEYQQKLSQNKMAIEDLLEEGKERYNLQLVPHLASYMLAAREVYLGGKRPVQAAVARGLRTEILEKWVKYLDAPGKARPHLDQWQRATDADARQVALAYQARYQQRLNAWNKKLANWRNTARKMLLEMNMPPPPKPRFEPGEDRFFHEVYFEKDGPFAISEQEQERVLSAGARQTLARLRTEAEELRKSAPPEPDMACAVEEGEPVNQKVFIRGDYASLGEDAPKGFPEVLARADDPVISHGSGRRELAEWLVKQPLTARVMANRIWQGHFVEGIVRTPDNFGTTGAAPTHPELLDYLARRFIESGWSVKALHRLIMLSSAYQMASDPSPESLAADPENALFTRFFRRRLDVEEIHDAMLAVDGTLDLTMGGSMQSGFGTDGENSAARLSVKPEEVRRRTVYVPLRRANLPALLNLFDFGDATTVTGKRPLTNVAPQALFMLNSTFLTERSKNLAAAWTSNEPRRLAERVRKAYLQILNREATPEEIDAALTYVDGFKRRFSQNGSGLEAWQSLARALLASNDFVYVD
jgi:cytochrome c553